MSYPTILSPWFIVYRLHNKSRTVNQHDLEMQYYRNPDVDANENIWTTDQHWAMLITSLQSAARIAKAVAGEVRVLTTRDELFEFRPEGDV